MTIFWSWVFAYVIKWPKWVKTMVKHKQASYKSWNTTVRILSEEGYRGKQQGKTPWRGNKHWKHTSPWGLWAPNSRHHWAQKTTNAKIPWKVLPFSPQKPHIISVPCSICLSLILEEVTLLDSSLSTKVLNEFYVRTSFTWVELSKEETVLFEL